MIRLLSLVLLGAITCFSACSGGSGTADGAPRQGLFVLFDTAAGTDAVLTGQLQGIALEAPGGGLTAVPLSVPTSVLLAHPTGSLSGLELEDAPRGTWTAVHLVFAKDGLNVRMANGRDHRVRLPGSTLRAPLRSPTDTRTGWVELRHASTLQLQAMSSDEFSWRSHMVAKVGDLRRLLDAEIEILSVDVDGRTAVGELEDCDEMPVKLEFSDDALLLDPPSLQRLTPAEFLGRLKRGSKIVVDGLLAPDRTLDVFAALIDEHDDDLKRHGNKSKVEGSIVELVPDQKAFRLRLMRIRKAGSGFPNPAPTELTIGAGDARIKFSPRHGRHTGHLTYDSLKKGMFVEVEWHGAVVDGRVDAHKIKIKGQDRSSPFPVELEARVREVDVDQKLLIVVPRGDEPFRIGDRRYATAIVEFGPESVLVRKIDDSFRIIGVGDVKEGQRADVLGRSIEDNRVLATLVRIRDGD